MLSSHFQPLIQSLPLAPYTAKHVVLSCLVVGAVLVLWRLWRFSILPLFYPDDPIEIPYWIPGMFLFLMSTNPLLTTIRPW